MMVLTSLALIFLGAITLGAVCSKIKMPPLVGMLVTGIILGPFVLNLIAPEILAISADLRQLALLIILLRAGLNLNYKELQKNGRGAVLLCFIPALCELAAYSVLGTLLLKLSLMDSLLMGSVMASVSAAVIVPVMLKVKENGYGTKKGIPQMLMACASVDNAVVIVLFTAFLGMASSGTISFHIFWQTPVSIILGLVVGIVLGISFSFLFQKIHMRDTIKILLMLSTSFLLLGLQKTIEKWVPFSALLGIITMGAVLLAVNKVRAERLSAKFSKLWVMAEMLLFVLVGAKADLSHVAASGAIMLCVMSIALIVRAVGVYLCLIGTKLNQKERVFCMIASTPKAAVQAAIGAIPLTLGLASGNLILTAAVLSIMVTAPLGALAMSLTYKKLLTEDTPKERLFNADDTTIASPAIEKVEAFVEATGETQPAPLAE